MSELDDIKCNGLTIQSRTRTRRYTDRHTYTYINQTQTNWVETMTTIRGKHLSEKKKAPSI